MKRFFLSLITAAAFGMSFSAMAASPVAAKGFIDTVATQVMALVKNEALSKSEKQSKIESIFSDKVDINFVAKFVLGKH